MSELKIARGRGRASTLINAINRTLTPMSPVSSPPQSNQQTLLHEQFKTYNQIDPLTPATTPTNNKYTNPYLVNNIQFADCDEDDDKCAICDRPKANIICKNCGKIWKVKIELINSN